MSTIASKTVPIRFKSDSPRGHDPNIVLEVGGVNIANLSRRVVFTSEVGELATAEIDMFASGGFDVSLPAAVTVRITPFEHGEMDVTPLPDGGFRYTFTRKAP